MDDRSFELFWEIIFLDRLYSDDSTSTWFFILSDSIPAYKHDKKEKPTQKYCHHLKIQPKIVIFAKKNVFFR